MPLLRSQAERPHKAVPERAVEIVPTAVPVAIVVAVVAIRVAMAPVVVTVMAFERVRLPSRELRTEFSRYLADAERVVAAVDTLHA